LKGKSPLTPFLELR